MGPKSKEYQGLSGPAWGIVKRLQRGRGGGGTGNTHSWLDAGCALQGVVTPRCCYSPPAKFNDNRSATNGGCPLERHAQPTHCKGIHTFPAALHTRLQSPRLTQTCPLCWASPALQPADPKQQQQQRIRRASATEYGRLSDRLGQTCVHAAAATPQKALETRNTDSAQGAEI